MKKIMVPLAILMIAILSACGSPVDTDALAEQAGDLAGQAGDLAQQGLDAAQDALDEATAEEEPTQEPTATAVPPTEMPTEVPEVHTVTITNLPAGGSEFEPNTEITLNFDYTTTAEDGVYILIQPVTGGEVNYNVEASYEQYVEQGSGSGSSYLLPNYDTTIDQVQVQIYDLNFVNVLFEEKIDVNYVVSAPVVEEEVHPVFNELADDVALRGSNVANDYDGGAGVVVNVGAAFEYGQSTWNYDFPQFNVSRGELSWIVWIDPAGSGANTNVLVPKFSETKLGKEANDKLIQKKYLKVTSVGAVNNPILEGDTLELSLSNPNSSDGPYTVTFYRGDNREVVTSFTIE